MYLALQRVYMQLTGKTLPIAKLRVEIRATARTSFPNL